MVDDDDVILSTFSMALRNAGYRVFEAKTGLTALEVAQEQLPDLIISDINMPGGDGEALLHHIRQHPDLSHKQVVLMTGQGDQRTSRRGMEAGADDFLVKPIGLAALLSCVEARLKRARVNWRVEDLMLTELRTSLQSNLPHEFFTPLGGILGLTEILRAELPGMPVTEVKEILVDIHHSALRLHRTLRNYLTVLELRSSTGSAKLPKPLPPAEVERSVWSGVRAAAQRHQRKADIDVQLAPPAIITTASDLSLIVEELVDNACCYSRQGTPIRVELDAEGVLTITDSGRGISEEEMQQIGVFQQFERRKYEQQGLGLGLVLLHKLTAQCGTKPVIKSEPGKGTQIQIAFMKPIPSAPSP
jgi:two-component system sensor histidine kinase/response regulator